MIPIHWSDLKAKQQILFFTLILVFSAIGFLIVSLVGTAKHASFEAILTVTIVTTMTVVVLAQYIFMRALYFRGYNKGFPAQVMIAIVLFLFGLAIFKLLTI